MNYIHHQDIVLDAQGRPVAGALVTVAGYPSGTATIYSDEGSTEISGTTTDTKGRYGFYAAPGRYTITINAAGIGTVTVEDVPLDDATYLTDWSAFVSGDFSGTWAASETGTYGTPSWKYDADGILRLAGKIARASGTTTAPETVVTLPAGGRPGKRRNIVVAGVNGSAANIAVPVSIFSTGEVKVLIDGVAAIHLEGIVLHPASQ